MELALQDLVEWLGGELVGNPDQIITGPSRIEEGNPGSITFLHDIRYESHLYSTLASVVLVSRDFKPKKAVKAALLFVDHVQAAMAQVLTKFAPPSHWPTGIADESVIHPSVTLGRKVTVGIYTVIGENGMIGDHTVIFPQVFLGRNVTLGRNCILYPGVRIMSDCILGDHCIVHANAVIGSEGFGFVASKEAGLSPMPQIGNVVLGNHVEIGAGSTVDRAVLGSTMIAEGVKIDNLVQVGHNVEIGPHTVIAAQSGIAGSTRIGAHCEIGGQVGFSGHLNIANGSRIQGKSGVAYNIDQAGQSWMGFPAMPYIAFLRSFILFRDLPAWVDRIRRLEQKSPSP